MKNQRIGSRAARVALLGMLAALAMGVRRPIACDGDPGTPRLLQVDAPDGSFSPDLSHPTRTRTLSELVLQQEGPYSPFSTVRWRGDTSSYVDVFDVPILAAPPDGDSDAIDGARFANVVRLPYPRVAVDEFVAEYEPARIFADARAGWDGEVPAWRGARALRMYDRGECSAAETWRNIGESFAEGVDAALGESRDAEPIGNWVVTYDIRNEFRGDRDRFTFSRPYEITVVDDLIRVTRTLQFTGQFTATDGVLGFRLFDAATIDPAGAREPLSDSDRMDIEDSIAAGMKAALAQPLPLTIACSPGAGGDRLCFGAMATTVEAEAGAPDGSFARHNATCLPAGARGECHFVPNVYRVNHRVDGIELVLSETAPEQGDADPFYPLLEEADTCRGLGVRNTQPRACVHDGVFEITPPNRRGIRICGEAALTR